MERDFTTISGNAALLEANKILKEDSQWRVLKTKLPS
jgi:hypothetical protein